MLINEPQMTIIKPYTTLLLTIVSITISSIFWVQGYSEKHFYPINSGEYVEQEITDIREEIEKIRDQNTEMILMLGRIEGALSND